MRALFVGLLLLGLNSGAFAATEDPALPKIIGTEDAIKAFVEKTVHDSPPAGGDIVMLKHFPPHYAKNDRVGEIWIIPAIVKVTLLDKSDYEEVFTVYHVDTDAATLEVDIGIPDGELDKYLDQKPTADPTPTPVIQMQSVFTPPAHPPQV